MRLAPPNGLDHPQCMVRPLFCTSGKPATARGRNSMLRRCGGVENSTTGKAGGYRRNAAPAHGPVKLPAQWPIHLRRHRGLGHAWPTGRL